MGRGRYIGGRIAYIWGLGGVVLAVLDALYRLIPRGIEAFSYRLTWGHWLFLVGWLGFMGFVEGYRGFHLSFSPRVIVRARYLRDNPRFLDIVLAPFFCSSLFRASRRRLIASWGMVTGIVSLILLIRTVAQPWRGLVDAGVVVGLTIGLMSMAVWFVRARSGRPMPYAPDLGEPMPEGEREPGTRQLSPAPTPRTRA